MKKILVFGAGRSATVLIDYLVSHAGEEKWELSVADADLSLAQSKTGNSENAKAVSFDINDESVRNRYIEQTDIVISLLPPTLHFQVAKSCVQFKKNLLTASYIDDDIRSLQPQIEESGLLFLCEMGLDPGIDHMSAMALIDKIHAEGGKVVSFRSHCGGLISPESDDNPWHYKISWNSRNILLAGKAGARFRENGEEIFLKYKDLFNPERLVEIPGLGFYSWYPNRDSLGYALLYGLEDVPTFVRTTLRHPDFMYGWKNVTELNLTDETPLYQTDNKTLMDFFKEHMEKAGFSDWVAKKISERLDQSKKLLENLLQITESEEEAQAEGTEIDKEFMLVDEKGKLRDLDLDEVKNNAAAAVANKMHEANLTLKQLFFLGMDDNETLINKSLCSAADVMQLCLEKNLSLKPNDKDMIVMLHEIGYENPGSQPARSCINSHLIVKGEDAVRTAMAKTVGLPLGIATKLILNGTIGLKGLHIPVSKEIYIPVLSELKSHGISFTEDLKPLT